MLSRKNKRLLMKCVSLFSVVRGYNIPIIFLAQYLSAIFILAGDMRALHVLLDPLLLCIVLASAITIASGYIINNFYDSQKDLINRPRKSLLDRLVSQGTKLRVYFTLNFIAVAIAFIVSWRAAAFFSVYIFLIWFYSHKVKKYLLVGNLMSTLLAIFPFFAILLYYKNFEPVIFGHATFLWLLLLMREIVKDLENLTGDLANNYHTIAVEYGESKSKQAFTTASVLTLIPVYLLIERYDVGYMDLYLYVSLIVLTILNILLWKKSEKSRYLLVHNGIKALIVAGVFCIVLIDPGVLLHGKKLL
ncbi:geranylgeranylglycerol-phosphate geranylgeranyltransferase [Flavobacterium sp.]|uniref:geranylgeranylglycerol-phosphate geranylgeranyltransferase n=1 Tax=Flavobacterium sp. TaxID=239 RepID=UPI002622B906|nr:geranylgeranylglycerol-phosphate geranylgeranyltransferase [Flavobacterium sp.]